MKKRPNTIKGKPPTRSLAMHSGYLTMHVKVLHLAQPSVLLIGLLPLSQTAEGHSAQHELVKIEGKEAKLHQPQTEFPPPDSGHFYLQTMYEGKMSCFPHYNFLIGNTTCC